MSKNKILKNVQNLKNLSMIIKDANKPAFYDIIEKYKNGEIVRFDTAFNFVMKLSKARGTGQTKVKTTVANIGKPQAPKTKHKSRLDNDVADDDGVISKSGKSSKTPTQTKPRKSFYITADLNCEIEFISKVTKKSYPKNHIYENVAKEIQAETVEEAKEMYLNACQIDYREKYARGKTTIKSIDFTSIVDKSEMQATPTDQMMMKRAQAVKYTFFPEVFDKFEKNDGYCVFNTFVATYSKYIKKLTDERFLELCYQVRGQTITNVNSLNSLDKDVEDDAFDDTIKNSWTKEDGVSPKMLFEI